MAREEHSHAGITGGAENFQNLSGYFVGVLDLAQNADLHVVDKQSDVLRAAHIFKSLWDVESKNALHICAENIG